ncbi:MAG TPA: 23S rRNA (uracil(1939)-C(5))-methyltransferase RlmD [Planctomycetota bacterium]|nr:23S rRNA (uracil(1939)-C(5))-methyltransferase RlmD [Planctomycetota bacterium]
MTFEPSSVPSPRAERKPRWGDECELVFDHLDARGNSVGAWGIYTASERGGLLGARVRARVVSRRREALEVRTVEILERGPHAVLARCSHHGVCGGCTFQDLAYAAQLEAKANVAREILRGGGLELQLTAVVPCADPWHYRNKMDFTFGTQRWRERADVGVLDDEKTLALGLHPRGFHSKLLEVKECAIAFAGAAEIVQTARKLALEQSLDAYDSYAHRGWLRHLVLRKSWHNGEILAALVTTDESNDRAIAIMAPLLAAHPEITTFVQLVNSGRALVAIGEREIVRHGRGSLQERVASNDFEIGPATFFQTNTPQAERLFQLVLERADLRANDVVHDLYCGGGAITLALAKRATPVGEEPNVLGFELVDAAIVAAREAALRNAVHNVRFFSGDVLTTWRGVSSHRPADVIVVDPPRAGVHPKVLAALAGSSARRIVMVSCQLESGVRDGAVLVRAGWKATHVDAVDLFPHTPHLECILTFERVP